MQVQIVEEMREEIAHLRRQIAELRGADRVTSLKVALNLPPQRARVLALLEKRGQASRDVIYGQVLEYANGDGPEFKIIDVVVCHLRKKLKALGAPDGITTIWGIGYGVTPELQSWLAERVPHGGAA